ncbi:hypothetical protein Tco_0271327 [Tanacetum coccineum]
MTPATISSGLVLNPHPSTPFVPPLRIDWDILIQPLFNELITPPPSVDHPAPEVIAPIAEVVAPEPNASTDSPSSTTVDQDAPSPNVAHMNNDSFFGISIPKNDSEASFSSDVIPTIVHTAAPNSEHVNKWTKDHPLDNIIETEGALELGPERARVLFILQDLTAEEKFGTCEEDSVKVLSLTPTNDDMESQLYDEFERFLQIKEETIHVYYVRRYKESNFDQLYAYLKQHEVHANENRMMMEMFIQPTNDQLALVSNASIQQYPTQSSMSQSTKQPSPADNFQLDSGSSSTENLIESLTNSLSLLTQSNKATVQDDRVVVQDVRGQAKPIKGYNCNGLRHIARECPRPKRPQDSNYFKDNMLLMQAQENGADLDEEL